MIEFYLILSAVEPTISAGIFWRLLIGTVMMLAFGYMGESKLSIPKQVSVLACADGVSSCSKSSWVKLALSLLVAKR